MSATSFTDLAYLSMRDCGVLRPAQTGAADLLADMRIACNNMMDSWKLDRLMVLRQSILELTLTTNVYQYQIGPAEVSPNLAAVRPTYIEQANIILNNFSPVVRQPVALIDYPQWADIRVQVLPNAIPQVLYYDRGYDRTDGWGTIWLWPAPMIAYGLELYTWDQEFWDGFSNLTTSYSFPPGYIEMIQKQLAVKCYPMMRPYLKIPMDPETMAALKRDAMQLKMDFEAYNAPSPQSGCDPAFLSANQGGSWVYATGEDRILGRG